MGAGPPGGARGPRRRRPSHRPRSAAASQTPSGRRHLLDGVRGPPRIPGVRFDLGDGDVRNLHAYRTAPRQLPKRNGFFKPLSLGKPRASASPLGGAAEGPAPHPGRWSVTEDPADGGDAGASSDGVDSALPDAWSRLTARPATGYDPVKSIDPRAGREDFVRSVLR
jgi:hypothetical protein